MAVAIPCSIVFTYIYLYIHCRPPLPLRSTGSPAAQAGIVASSCILKVGEESVLLKSHEEVVAAVRRSLSSTAKEEGGPKVEFKLSNPFMEHMTVYSYETGDSASIDVYERLIETPYIFSVPSQVGQVYLFTNDPLPHGVLFTNVFMCLFKDLLIMSSVQHSTIPHIL